MQARKNASPYVNTFFEKNTNDSKKGYQQVKVVLEKRIVLSVMHYGNELLKNLFKLEISEYQCTHIKQKKHLIRFLDGIIKVVYV